MVKLSKYKSFKCHLLSLVMPPENNLYVKSIEVINISSRLHTIQYHIQGQTIACMLQDISNVSLGNKRHSWNWGKRKFLGRHCATWLLFEWKESWVWRYWRQETWKLSTETRGGTHDNVQWQYRVLSQVIIPLPLCNFQAVNRIHLNIHNRNIHSQPTISKLFNCHHCDYQSHRQWNVQRHEEKSHYEKIFVAM